MIAFLAEAQSTVGAKTEETVLRLLIQVILILAVTRIVTVLVRWLGQTDVSGEILAGILLGPSLLSAVFPETMRQIFHPSTDSIFVGIAQIGLVLLMFQIGLEFEFRSHLKESKKSILAISLTGIALPFAAGYFTAPWFWEQLAEPRPSLLGFRLFFAVAMSITAIPILGRIFMELGLSHTRTAAITIGSAAIDDVLGWLLLGSISLIIEGSFSAQRTAARVGMLGAYLAVAFFVLRPWMRRWLGQHLERHGQLRMPAISILLLVLFVSAVITSSLGVFAIIGGFVLGVALHDDRRFVQAWKTQVSPLVNTFFLPMFFAFTGLRTDIGSIHGGWGLFVCALVVAVAFASKFGGAYLAARAIGEPARSAFAIGVCMNTRALMELIVLNIGYDLGVLPRDMFTMLVIMAIASTFLATPLIRWAMRGEMRGEVIPKRPSHERAHASS